MNPRVGTVPLALAALALAGCSSVGGAKGAIGTTPTTSPTTAATSSTPAAAPVTQSAAPSTPAAASSPTTADFGPAHYVSYKGLRVSILSATPYTPTADAAGTKPGDKAFAVKVRLTNTGTAQFDPTLTTVAAHAGANGDQGSSITDDNTEAGFQGAIPAGQSATAEFAFDVPAADLPGTVTVLVSPGFDYEDAPFSGPIS